MIELPAFSEDQYDAQAQPQGSLHRRENSSEQQAEPALLHNGEFHSKTKSTPESTAECDNENTVPISPTQCLFCPFDSPTLTTNMTHMCCIHGLFIPSPDRVSDLESFLAYLATIVFTYHECLYCYLQKGSVNGVQTHMRDKGHCMINLSAKSELLDFWELSDDSGDEGTTTRLSSTEMRLPSGVVVASRADATQLRVKPGLASRRSQHRSKRGEMQAITVDETAREHVRGHDHRVAVRGEMRLAGVSDSQRLALQVTEKKMKRREAVAKAAQRYAMEQEPIKTKYYKVRGI
jgi:pre-60S factor REI1